MNSPGERDLPVLRQVLDGPQQLGEPLVVVVQRAQQRRCLRARRPRGRRRLRRRDGGQHRLGRRGSRGRRPRHRLRRRGHQPPRGVERAHPTDPPSSSAWSSLKLDTIRTRKNDRKLYLGLVVLALVDSRSLRCAFSFLVTILHFLNL